MEKDNTMLAVVGLAIAGVLAAGIIGYNAGKDEGMQGMHKDMMKMSSLQKSAEDTDHSLMTMDQMSGSLEDLKGDAFDKAFLEMMIVHHQGAVDMAKHIPAQAKHPELKKLGTEIIAAQTKEITMMKQWLKDWGYDGTASSKMEMEMQGMDHNMMGH